MNSINISKSVLRGKISISGAKNSVLKLLTASILTDSKIILHNYPSGLLDAKIHFEMLKTLGKSCEIVEDNLLTVSEHQALKTNLKWEDRSIRNTLLMLGALTTRFGFGSVPLPGGCKLGDRSFDLHVMLLESLGARVWQENEMLCAEAPRDGLKGAEIFLPIRSTGATENAIISGTLAQGVTRIWNPHIRPEITDLITFLNKMGAKIKVFGQEHIEITGVEGLGGASHTVMPDNMEAITWLVGAVMTGGDIEIQHFPHRDLEVALIHLRESGARFFHGENSLIVRGGHCFPLEVSTGPHPGINSDVQPILAAYAACAKGESRIVDLRFPGRYGYAEEMAKLGVTYSIDGNVLKIYGNGGALTGGATVKAVDLRAGAALMLCAMVAEGISTITDAWQIERGYNNFIKKAHSLEAKITVI